MCQSPKWSCQSNINRRVFILLFPSSHCFDYLMLHARWLNVFCCCVICVVCCNFTHSPDCRRGKESWTLKSFDDDDDEENCPQVDAFTSPMSHAAPRKTRRDRVDQNRGPRSQKDKRLSISWLNIWTVNCQLSTVNIVYCTNSTYWFSSSLNWRDPIYLLFSLFLSITLYREPCPDALRSDAIVSCVDITHGE